MVPFRSLSAKLSALVVLTSLAVSLPSQAERGRAEISDGTVKSDQNTLLRGPFIKLVNRKIYTVGSEDPQRRCSAARISRT